ncbi:MAG: class I SAM-dependent methyltransferase [Candidatus Omnitrophica bacterium]|nr:class I SAM-dependent methyltransferase [Candidatus Omnitrophota bacterium]
MDKNFNNTEDNLYGIRYFLGVDYHKYKDNLDNYFYDRICNKEIESLKTKRYVWKKIFEIFDRFALTKESLILDMGCGWGEIALELIRRDFKVVGIDLSYTAIMITQGLIDTYSALIQRPLQRGYWILRTDACKLPFKKESFDCIIQADLMEHLNRRKTWSFLSECRRVLKSDGFMIIHTAPSRWWFNYHYLRAIIKGSRNIFSEEMRRHINLQSTFALKRALKAHFLEAKIWTEDNPAITKENLNIKGRLFCFLKNLPIFNDLLAYHIFGIVTKKR